MENNNQNSSTLMLNDYIKGYIIEISKWAKFLSILGFIGLGFMMIASIIMLFAGSMIDSYSNSSNPLGAGIVGIIYLVMAALYFFPILYLFKSSVSLKNGILSNDEMTLTDGFQNLKSHYKFIGIFTIVIISLYILIFIIGIMAFAFR